MLSRDIIYPMASLNASAANLNDFACNPCRTATLAAPPLHWSRLSFSFQSRGKNRLLFTGATDVVQRFVRTAGSQYPEHVAEARRMLRESAERRSHDGTDGNGADRPVHWETAR